MKKLITNKDLIDKSNELLLKMEEDFDEALYSFNKAFDKYIKSENLKWKILNKKLDEIIRNV